VKIKYFSRPLYQVARQLKNIQEKRMNYNLDKEEQDILESFENNEWKSVSDLDKCKKILQKYARNTLLKNKRVNIRISERDMTELKKRAVEEGLPYQTLISSILHKYINRSLVPKT